MKNVVYILLMFRSLHDIVFIYITFTCFPTMSSYEGAPKAEGMIYILTDTTQLKNSINYKLSVTLFVFIKWVTGGKMCRKPPLSEQERLRLLELVEDNNDILSDPNNKLDVLNKKKDCWEKVKTYGIIIIYIIFLNKNAY